MIPEEKPMNPTKLSSLIGLTVPLQAIGPTSDGTGFKACCPFHDEVTPSFTVNDATGEYQCLSCGAHGGIISWLKLGLRLTADEALGTLEALIGAGPPPMRTNQPPMDGRWILGHVPHCSEFHRTRPWVIVTRTDEGFVDQWGDEVMEVEGWLPLPDPQPRPTSWRPPRGALRVCRARIAGSGWEGWMMTVMNADGTDDDSREPWLYDNEADVDMTAKRYSDTYSLPIFKDATAFSDADAGLHIDHGKIGE